MAGAAEGGACRLGGPGGDGGDVGGGGGGDDGGLGGGHGGGGDGEADGGGGVDGGGFGGGAGKSLMQTTQTQMASSLQLRVESFCSCPITTQLLETLSSAGSPTSHTRRSPSFQPSSRRRVCIQTPVSSSSPAVSVATKSRSAAVCGTFSAWPACSQ